MTTRLVTALTLSVACAQTPSPTKTSDTSDSRLDTADSFADTDTDSEVDPDDNWTLPETSVGTLAGSGERGSADGERTAATFNEPRALAFHPDGSLIVLEASGLVRRIDSEGMVSTIYIQAVELVNPSGVVIDDDGTMWISDASLGCVVEVTSRSSRVFAGVCGERGYTDGIEGLMDQPRGLALEADGTLLIADTGNMRIRAASATGALSTVAGTGAFALPSEGPAAQANVYMPFAVHRDDDGAVFFAGMDSCIRTLQDGQVENLAGLCSNYGNTGFEDGVGEAARFDQPWGLDRVDATTLVVADMMNDAIRLVDPTTGEVTTLTGSTPGHQDGALEDALFSAPRGVAVHPDGWVAVADTLNHRIRVVQP